MLFNLEVDGGLISVWSLCSVVRLVQATGTPTLRCLCGGRVNCVAEVGSSGERYAVTEAMLDAGLVFCFCTVSVSDHEFFAKFLSNSVLVVRLLT